MLQRPPRSTVTDTLVPDTPLFRSPAGGVVRRCRRRAGLPRRAGKQRRRDPAGRGGGADAGIRDGPDVSGRGAGGRHQRSLRHHHIRARLMRLLLINPNTTQAVTDQVLAVARGMAAPGTELTGVTGRFGAAYVS